MSKEIKPVDQNLPAVESADVNPMTIIATMAQAGTDADTLEKMMDLQERWEANNAKREFDAAITAFQAECPVIQNIKQAPKSKYAPIDHVVKMIRPLLNRHGLSVRFDVEPTLSSDGSITVITATCYVSHVSGHTEENSFPVPVDSGPVSSGGKRVMNPAQAIASARSYAKRYALGDGLNLVFADEVDDDAAYLTQQVDLATDEQWVVLNEYRDAGQMEENQAKWLDKRIDTLTEEQASNIINKLKSKS